jgi:hypothetical protein
MNEPTWFEPRVRHGPGGGATIEHTFPGFVPQPGATRQAPQTSRQLALQADAWLGHSLLQSWPVHDMHDIRSALQVCTHAEAAIAHEVAHDASGLGDPVSAEAGAVWAASAPASAGLPDASSVVSSRASAGSTLRAPSSTMSSHPLDASARTTATRTFTM